jgi:polysaccharide deacetylase 2 family uncharacterized protein YibQ
MTADELSAPLGQMPRKQRRKFPIAVPHVIAGALALFLGTFVLWTIVGDDPFGGEPMVTAPVDLRAAAAVKKPEPLAAPENAANPQGPHRYDGPAPASAPPEKNAPANPPPNTKTVTIIDGKTGARQEVVIPDPAGAAAPAAAAPPEQKFAEMTSHGPVPKIAADGTRPADVFARPVKALAGRPGAPRVALIVAGLGVSTSATSTAIAQLPGPVTFAFMPYGAEVERLAALARSEGHEILLQVPMEPFNYPDNDPGPQTLLTSLTPEQNLERLYWLMSRMQGYVGLAEAMGARFTASEPAFAPILRETARRGLIFVDDGANPRSVAARIAGANNLPFAKADIVLDAVPTPDEIDRALGRLEMTARERSLAVGIASALPVSLEHIGKWAKAAESRGLLLVPITSVVMKEKQS